MYCQPPLQSWGTFYLEKKVLCSCRDRQDGSPVESAPRLAEQAARAGQPNASTTGKRRVCGLALDPSAQPRSLPARDRRLTCTCAEMRPAVLCVRAWEQQLLDQPRGSRAMLMCLPCAHLSLLLRPRKGKWKPKADTATHPPLISILCFRAAGGERCPQLKPQSGVFFRFSSLEIVLARARFFTEGNYQRGPAFMDEAWWKVIENDYFLF